MNNVVGAGGERENFFSREKVGTTDSGPYDGRRYTLLPLVGPYDGRRYTLLPLVGPYDGRRCTPAPVGRRVGRRITVYIVSICRLHWLFLIFRQCFCCKQTKEISNRKKYTTFLKNALLSRHTNCFGHTPKKYSAFLEKGRGPGKGSGEGENFFSHEKKFSPSP